MYQNQETKEMRVLKHNAYISAPMTIFNDFKAEVREFVMELFEEHYDEHPYGGINVDFWINNLSYNDTLYKRKIQHEIDIFILILPSNAFKTHISNLTSGIRKEYEWAKEAKRNIYLAYTNKDGEIGIYNVIESGGLIEGVGGTRNHLFKTLDKNGQIMEYPKTPEESFPITSQVNSKSSSSLRDLRLLLLI